MYSQERMRMRWMGGRVRRVARVGLAADDHDEGAVLSICAYMGIPPAPTVSGHSGHLSK
jgi:hypothetical protein